MYRIVMIDDERLVIKSLRATIKWEEYGFEVVGEAYNGTDGIKLIQEKNPDLVFIDIRMPGIDGLQVISKVKEMGMDTLFAVVSGYAEFKYAQKAIREGAIGYCLKPFSEDDISECLLDASKRLDSIKEMNMTTLYRLLDEPYEKSEQQMESVFSKLDIYNKFDDGLYFAVIIEKDNMQLKYPSDMLGLRLGRTRYGVFIPKGDLNYFLTDVVKSLNKEYISVGISNLINDINHLKKGIDEARNAVWYYFVTGRKAQVYRSDYVCAKEGGNLLKEVEECCYNRDNNRLIEVLSDIQDAMDNRKIKPRHIVRLYNYLRGTVSILDEDVKMEEDYISSIEQLAEIFVDAKEVLTTFISLIDRKENSSNIKQKKIKNITAKQILEYVDSNYTDDIAIRQISKIFFINPSYLSQLFKKEFGETFTSYLTKLRIEHACNLLSSTSMPISEIAEESGYTDYFYFARVFKKITNKTASQYRYQ